MPLSREEINRKVLHLGALVMPAGIFYLPALLKSYTGVQGALADWMPTILLAIAFFSSVTVEKLRMKHDFIQDIFHKMFGSMLRHEEKHQTTGSTWIIGASLICSIVFFSRPDISLMTLSIFILGDAVAALAGQSIGGKVIRFRVGKKSMEGSLACFLLCLSFFYGVFPFLPLVLDGWNGHMPFRVAVAAALSTTIFELIPLRVSKTLVINDNLAVPVITGAVMLGLHSWLF